MRAGIRPTCVTGLVIVAGWLALSAPAGAVTVGQTPIFTGSPCVNTEFYAEPSSVGNAYTIPLGGGTIDKWSFATFGAPTGPVTVLVLTPSGFSYQIDAFDTETLPNPLPTPAGTPVTFTPGTPLQAPAGAVLGLYFSPTTMNAQCLFGGSPGDSFSNGSAVTPTALGTYTASSPPGTSARLNVSANLVQNMDAGLTTTAHPATATAGGLAAFTFTLTNTGVSTGTASFSDNIPNGLSIVSAAAGSGTCSTISQLVSCSIVLAPGASAPISIVVSTSSAGTFTNTGTVTTNLSDPNTANNAATATLAVTAGTPTSSCHVIALKGVPLAVAKSILTALSCRPGAVAKKRSKSVHKGFVISTSPGPGSHTAGTTVKLTVSSGKPKKHS